MEESRALANPGILGFLGEPDHAGRVALAPVVLGGNGQHPTWQFDYSYLSGVNIVCVCVCFTTGRNPSLTLGLLAVIGLESSSRLLEAT